MEGDIKGGIDDGIESGPEGSTSPLSPRNSMEGRAHPVPPRTDAWPTRRKRTVCSRPRDGKPLLTYELWMLTRELWMFGTLWMRDCEPWTLTGELWMPTGELWMLTCELWMFAADLPTCKSDAADDAAFSVMTDGMLPLRPTRGARGTSLRMSELHSW